MSKITNEVNHDKKEETYYPFSWIKAESLKLAEKAGVAAAATQLSLHESQIYTWRKTVKKGTTTSQREQELAAEVAKLKRQLAEQAEELDIAKRLRPTSRKI